MNNLKQKIKNTALFAPDEKIDILVAIDTFSASDITELESIVDEYDAKYRDIMQTFKTNMVSELDMMVTKAKPESKVRISEAVDKMKKGFTAVIPN